jgi:hypothetical protein
LLRRYADGILWHLSEHGASGIVPGTYYAVIINKNASGCTGQIRSNYLRPRNDSGNFTTRETEMYCFHLNHSIKTPFSGMNSREMTGWFPGTYTFPA